MTEILEPSMIDFLQSFESENELSSILKVYVDSICDPKSWKQSRRIDLNSSAPLRATLICDLRPLLRSESKASINPTHLFNQATGGGTNMISLLHIMPPLLFSRPLARLLAGRVLRFVKAAVSQQQVDRW